MTVAVMDNSQPWRVGGFVLMVAALALLLSIVHVFAGVAVLVLGALACFTNARSRRAQSSRITELV